MINSALIPMGLRLSLANNIEQLVAAQKQSASLLEVAQKHANLIAEVESLVRELLFPDLADGAGRTELLARLYGTNVTEAMYLLQYLHKSLPYAGDVCEFGVAQGRTSALIANEIRSTDKNLWLFDSFQGLPKPTAKDELIDDMFNLQTIENYEGTMACPVDMVEANLRAIQFPSARTRIIPGFVEETFARPDLPANVCFAYLDFDFYEPILITLRFLHERLAPHGYIVVDDYGFFSSGAKTAVDEFVAAHADSYELSLPYKAAGKFCIIHKTS